MQVYRAVGTDAHGHTHQPWPAATRQRVAEHGTTDQATAGREPWWDGGTTDGVGAATRTWSSVCATYFFASPQGRWRPAVVGAGVDVGGQATAVTVTTRGPVRDVARRWLGCVGQDPYGPAGRT